jgi:hypothetical protein
MKSTGAIVNCAAHGRFNNGNKQYEVKVGLPKHMRERLSGCPMCRKGVPATSTADLPSKK